MASIRVFTTLALALALALPVGAATWFTQGTYEPDTRCDDASGCVNPATGELVSGGWMYSDAPGSDTDGLRVYLNAYTDAGQFSGVNPNSELTGGRVLANSHAFHAYFGVWKDCDEDGYIGTANGALHVYTTAAVAVNTDVCPDGSVFNKAGWVYEFQWIGPAATIAGNRGGEYPSADDQRYINDSEARVWADWDLPGTVTFTSVCSTGPAFGTTSSTGGFLFWADCITARRVATAINDVSTAGGLGIGFEDPARPQESSSPLNQDTPVNVFGNPYSGENDDEWQTGLFEYNSRQDRDAATYDPDQDYDPSQDERAFDVWDCSQPEGTSSDFGGIPTADPTVSDDPLHASWYDGLNATERGTYGVQDFILDDTTGIGGNGLLGTGHTTCSETETSNLWWVCTGLCNFPEQGMGGTDSGAGRDRTDVTFTFTLGGQAPRGRTFVPSPVDSERELVGTAQEDAIEGATGGDTGDHLNSTLGQGYQLGLDHDGQTTTRPAWSGFRPWLNTGPISRATLQPYSGRYVTVYGTFGAATTGIGATTANGNAPALYANEWCDGVFNADSNVGAQHDGFNCDASKWWPGDTANDESGLPNGIDITVRPGQPYYVRDVDCYDGTLVRGLDVQASLVAVSQFGPCEDSSN